MNKQIVMSWGWDHDNVIHILPNIVILSKREVEIVWLCFYIDFYHPKKDVYEQNL